MMRLRFLAATAAFLAAVGCGGVKTAPVSGVVNLDGKPLANATVTFQPVAKEGSDAPASVAETDAQGKYTLKLINGNQSGAIVGQHRVAITALQGPAPDSANDNAKPRKDRVPTNYNTNTDLKFDVPPEGSDKANFDLVTNRGS